jgi:hypothetical protein
MLFTQEENIMDVRKNTKKLGIYRPVVSFSFAENVMKKT